MLPILIGPPEVVVELLVLAEDEADISSRPLGRVVTGRGLVGALVGGTAVG